MSLFKNKLKFLFLIVCWASAPTEHAFSAASGAGADIPEPTIKRAYVFYRGYHFLAGAEPLDEFSEGVGFESRPVAEGEVKDVTTVKAQMTRLNRPWTEAEKTEFSPDCSTLYRELVQLYTNDYKKFTEELKDKDSRTRRIFRLEGIEVSSNPFVSTTLRAYQAYRYGSGHKLYGIDQLRRSPEYNSDGVPKNKTIGYVDVYIVPESDYSGCGVFDVVGHFATGATKLKYHFSKDLTAEMEFIFPLFVPKGFHFRRIPIRMPNLKSPPKRMQKKTWLSKFSTAKSKEEKQDADSAFLGRLEKIESQRIINGINLQLGMQGIKVVNSHPILDGFRIASLTPSDAKALKKRVAFIETEIGHKYRNPASGQVSVDVKKQSRELAWALRNFADRGDKVSLDFSISLEKFDPDMMGIYLRNDNVKGIRFMGDTRHQSSLRSEFQNWVNWALKPRHRIDEESLDRYFISPERSKLMRFLSKAMDRKTPVKIDMRGILMHPAKKHLMTSAKNIELVADPIARESEEAYWWARKQLGIDEFEDDDEEADHVESYGFLGSIAMLQGQAGIMDFLKHIGHEGY